MPQDYNQTIHLPKTDFPMRASLPKKEPDILKKWQEEDIYNTLIQANADKPDFHLHDGPPYANGDIHIGHALNKILKDFIIRHKNMAGYCARYIPGWDTHGLPIELQAIKKLKIKGSQDVLEFRKLCQEFALTYSGNQSQQFQRLGSIGDYAHPYLTLHHTFEAEQIKIFGEMVKKGYIYKGLRPVYWCPHDETALAEAEIEYADDACDSIYVKFRVKDDKGLFSPYASLENVYFVIWTTTTWTLPANMAICLGRDFDYVLVQVQNGECYIIAKALLESVMQAAKILDYSVLASFKGEELERMTTYHPFLPRESLVILGDHVTLESGTGCVHTAPGHGVDDFNVCKNFYPEIPVIVPVDSKGRMTAEAGDRIAGLHYSKANEVILDQLREVNALLAIEHLCHSYPHCWRCKSPVIFRATEQWFCSVADFVDQTIDEIEKVQWIPAWGKERISQMVRERRDWCISRQRVWGVPIPIFYCEECGAEYCNEESIAAIAVLFEREGSDAWYKYSAQEILPAGAKCPKCGCVHFQKETDIMDVWFDSGSSYAAVMEKRLHVNGPVDMYLEGSDQYRGWFQSSLLTSVAARGRAPYKTVLTHGFTVDGEGKKMSKSLGNGIEPMEVIQQYGADILRLWVASCDYRVDIHVSRELFKQLSEVYRKIRNTARYMLGNLNGFDPNRDCVAFSDMELVDQWALMRLNKLVERVNRAYSDYEFHMVYHGIHNFCVVDMSNFYLDVIKDRLYCDATNSLSRKSAQTAMYFILDALVRMLTPILCFTAEEIWVNMPHKQEDDLRSPLFAGMPSPQPQWQNAANAQKMDIILGIREQVKKALEQARNEKVIGSSLEAQVELCFPQVCNAQQQAVYDCLASDTELLRKLFITSGVTINCQAPPVAEDAAGNEWIGIHVSPAVGEKCERCWTYSTDVGSDPDHPTLCKRCASAVKQV